MAFCSKCGAENAENAKFCRRCGNPFSDVQVKENLVPEDNLKKKSRLPFLLTGLFTGAVIALILFIAWNVIFKSADTKIEGSGYVIAEDAVTAYVEYLKEGDVDGMISTFAVESCVENYDPTAYYEYTQKYMPIALSNQELLPDSSELAKGINAECMKNYISENILRQYMTRIVSYFPSEIYTNVGTPITFSDEFDPEDLIKILDRDPGFRDMTVKNFLGSSDLFGSKMEMVEEQKERYNKTYEGIWNADDFKHIQLKLTIDQEDYYLFMTVIRYGDKWYNFSFGNYYSNAYGLVTTNGGLFSAAELELQEDE